MVEMQSILLNVKTSIEDRLASRFVPLKVKKMLSELKEDGYEDECKKFMQQIEELYSSCLDYLNLWVEQFHDLSPFTCMSLSGAVM